MKNISKKLFSCVLVVLLFAVCIPCANADSEITYFVSNDGNDSSKGTINAPFKTLEKARDTIRQLKNKPSGGITVYVRGGTYRVDKTFLLEEQDSGTEDCLITYSAYEDETVTFVGGASIDPNSFTAVTDEAVIAKMADGMKDKILQTDLKAQGITEYGELPVSYSNLHPDYKKFPNPPELFFDDESMTLARWPNNDYALVHSVIEAGQQTRSWQDDKKGTSGYIPEAQRKPYEGFTIAYTDKRVEKWADEKDMRLYGYWSVDWYTEHMTVKKIDTKKETITTETPTSYGVKAGQRYYAYNLFCELDSPGEYYLNRDTGILYFYPPADIQGKEIGFSLLYDPAVKLENASNIHITGFDFNYTRGEVVSGTGLKNCYVTDCSFKNTGGKCVNFSNSYDTIIANIKGFKTNGGVSVSGGSYATLTPGNNQILNCDFDTFDRITKTYNPAVNLGGVGNRAAYNHLRNADHMAIGYSGNDHIIEYNDIHDVLKASNDSGAIYAYISTSNFSMLGTVMRYNYIHHLGVKAHGGVNLTDSAATRNAIYHDGFCGTTVYGNVFYKVEKGILVNGGWSNKTYDNIFIETDVPMQITDLSLSLIKAFSTHTEITEAFNKYPEFIEQMSDPDFCRPKHNDTKDNLWDTDAEASFMDYDIRFLELEQVHADNDLSKCMMGTVSNADFKDFANEDFTLREDSWILKEKPEFEYADFSKIGLQDNLEELKVLERKSGSSFIPGASDGGSESASEKIVSMMINSPKALVHGKSVYIDENTKVTPILKDGFTFIPVRFTAEAMEAEVEYVDSTGDIIVKTDDKTVVLTLNSERMFVDGEEYTLRAIPYVLDGRVMIPLRDVAEILGLNVAWDIRGLVVLSDSTSYEQMAEGANYLTNLINQIAN